MKKNRKLIGVLLVAVIVILLSSIMLIINKNSKKEVIEEVYEQINPKINVSNIEYNMESNFPGFEKEIIIYDDDIKSTFRPEEKVKAIKIEIYKNNEYANLRKDVINEMNNIINEEFNSTEYGYEFSAYVKSINCYKAITKGRIVIILNSQYNDSLINNLELTDLNNIKRINVIEELPNKDDILRDEVNNVRNDLYNYKKSFNEWLDTFAIKVDNNLNNLLTNPAKENLELVENQVEILNIGYFKDKRNDWIYKLNKIKTTIK